MAPLGKILTYPGNLRVKRSAVIAEMNNLEIEFPPFTIGETNKTPEYLSKFPLGKVPVFEGADGFLLSEGLAIDTYIARSGPKGDQILGGDAKTQALIVKWTSFAESELVGNLMVPYLMAVYKSAPADQKRFDEHIAAAVRATKCIELSLEGGKKFLVGDSLTLADLVIVSYMFSIFEHFADAEWRKEIPNLVAYLEAFVDVPLHKKHFGELKMCETRAQC